MTQKILAMAEGLFDDEERQHGAVGRDAYEATWREADAMAKSELPDLLAKSRVLLCVVEQGVTRDNPCGPFVAPIRPTGRVAILLLLDTTPQE